jgi:hypothetical protein
MNSIWAFWSETGFPDLAWGDRGSGSGDNIRAVKVYTRRRFGGDGIFGGRGDGMGEGVGEGG